MNDSLRNKLAQVKLLVTDVDGVLTDGGLYYNADGMVMKRFNVKDGLGAVLLREKGIKVGIITTDDTPVVEARGKRLNLDFVCMRIYDKGSKLLELCSIYGIKPEETAFIGDDVNDISIMKTAGITACPADAVRSIKEMSGIILSCKGGEGAFREFSDLILEALQEAGDK